MPKKNPITRQSEPHEGFDPSHYEILFNPAEWEVPPGLKPDRKSKSQYLAAQSIPLVWVERAARISGATAVVALFLWHFRIMRKSPTVCLGIDKLRGDFTSDGSARTPIFSRSTVQRALRDLEIAELIQVDRRSGRCFLVITILDIPSSDSAAGGEQKVLDGFVN
jgi:hypothetical protein